MEIRDNCVYSHINPKTNQIYYIGKGTIKRAFNLTDRVPHYKEYLKENKFLYPKIKILEKNLTSDEADIKEQEYIMKFGRIGVEENGTLINQSNGGESGFHGVKSSESRKLKISEGMKKYHSTKYI